MMRRITVVISAAALLVAIGAVDTQSARHRGSHSRRPSAARRVAKPCVYPSERQIDGRTLWDLGKQNGQWPQLP